MLEHALESLIHLASAISKALLGHGALHGKEYAMLETQQKMASMSELFEGIYERLKEISSTLMSHQPSSHILQSTALVHEAFIRLADRNPAEFESNEHFLATVATVLRSVLVDHARRRMSQKRGGLSFTDTLDHFQPIDDTMKVGGILALEDALRGLAKQDARSAKVAELCIFGSLEMEHVARLLDVGLSTVKTDWRFAKAWLCQEYDYKLPQYALAELELCA